MIKKQVFMILFAVGVINANSYSQALYIDKGQLPATSSQGDFTGGGSNVVDVDLFTGIGSVNIPIYNYSTDGLDLSVFLNYMTKGIQVDQTASSVGLGWNLNAGGYIQRQVNGVEDEVSQKISVTQFVNCLGGGGPFSIPDTPYYKGRLVNHANVQNAYESESDKFTAVFGGRQVDFAIDANSNVSTNPHSGIKIQMFVDGIAYTSNLPSGISVDSTTHLLTFIITDEKGDQFQFIRGDYQDAPSLGGSTYYPTQRWVLSKLTTSTGKIVTYTYNDYYVSYKQYNNDTVNEQLGLSYYITGINSQPVYWTGHLSHISSINYPDGTVVAFNMGNAAARCDLSNISQLTGITISKGDVNFSNTVTFKLNQAYFNTIIIPSDPAFAGNETPLGSGTTCQYISELVSHILGLTSAKAQDTLNLSLRLKLKSITKVGTDGSSSELYYTFNYNSTPLPPRLSVSQDWYGYFNNHSFQATADGDWNTPISVPLHSITNDLGDPDSYGVNKTPDINYLQADILTSIINGLKGETDITYEAPPLLVDAVAPPSDMMATETFDGLCVSSLKYIDGFETNNSYTVNYAYQDGHRFFSGGYFPIVYYVAQHPLQ